MPDDRPRTTEHGTRHAAPLSTNPGGERGPAASSSALLPIRSLHRRTTISPHPPASPRVPQTATRELRRGENSPRLGGHFLVTIATNTIWESAAREREALARFESRSRVDVAQTAPDNACGRIPFGRDSTDLAVGGRGVPRIKWRNSFVCPATWSAGRAPA